MVHEFYANFVHTCTLSKPAKGGNVLIDFCKSEMSYMIFVKAKTEQK